MTQLEALYLVERRATRRADRLREQAYFTREPGEGFWARVSQRASRKYTERLRRLDAFREG